MAIDSKETCQLSFVIVNNSREPAYDVTPVIDIYGSKEILVSRSVSISYMSPGQKVRYTATVKGKKGLRDGEVEVNIYATDSSGAVSDGLRFTMPTYRKW